MSESETESGTAALVSALIEAYGSGKQIETVAPEQAPSDVAGAIEVQSAVAEALGGTPGGWKVSITPAGPTSAPMFRSGMLGNGASRPLGRMGGFSIEVEFAVRLKKDLILAAGATADREEILAAVDSMLVGIEFVESRLRNYKEQPFMAHLSDNLANSGYVEGAEIAFDPSANLTGRHCRIEIGGEVIFDETAVHGNGDPLVPLIDCANVTGAAMGGWRAGQIITLGSICGVIPVLRPGKMIASLEGVGEAAVTLE